MRNTASLATLVWAVTAVLSGATGNSITVDKPTLTFSYTVGGSTQLANQSLKVTTTGTYTTATLTITATSVPAGWLSVTPDTGRGAPTLSVIANPSALSPGSYSGLITIDTSPTSNNPATCVVTLNVQNPASTLSVTSSSPNYTSPPALLTFSYTTGATVVPARSAINVASTGDTIPFSVAAGAGSGSATGGGGTWARVNAANQSPSLSTSGVALAGSSVPITITVDPVTLASLAPGSYTNVISVVANSAKNGSATIGVTLVVAAGPPTVAAIYPSSVVAGPTIDQTLTIYGDNFFSTSVVDLQQNGVGAPPPVELKPINAAAVTRKVLIVNLPAKLVQNQGNFTIKVTNPAPPSNPSQAPASIPFSVISATQPAISAIVNAASYLFTSSQTGTNPNPVPNGATSLSPRELITIFGQNLGPAAAVASTATSAAAGLPLTFPTLFNGVNVNFFIPGAGNAGADLNIAAPLIMISGNQINAVVPTEVGRITAAAAPRNVVTVTVTYNGLTTPAFTATAVDFDPGVFSFDGLGKGQAAVLNYDDTSGSYLINSAGAKAGKGSTIIIYATGLGDLSDVTIGNGEVAGVATTLVANTTRVDIDGQPAVVSYAGTTPGAVAGLVQINAVVPPTVVSKVPTLTVSVGGSDNARRSQQLVTIQVQ